MSSDPISGEVLGERYELVRRIGAGGMGAVYEAIQSDLGRRVALKVLHQHLSLEPTLLERFRREALAAAALGHPNIVSVSDLQSPEGQPPFLVMELLTGMSLRQAINVGPLDPRRVAFIAAQVLSALGAAHTAKIVHRDVKPDNIILIDTTAMRDFVKVLDFGVAKLQRDKMEGLTVAGAILGTLSYMAPEQARGESLDGRADVYSVGACMYHALTGRKPFDKLQKAQLYAAVVLEPPTPIAELRPDLDAGLVAIVERAMQKRAADRFATADEMVAALLAWQASQGAHPAIPPPGAPRSPSLAPVPVTSLPTIPIETPGAPVLARRAERGTKSSSGSSSGERASSRGRLSLAWIVALGVLAGLALERLYTLFLTRPH
ncbi:MAG: serine/threonine-protein kinase [Polyangiaceae bacterium]